MTRLFATHVASVSSYSGTMRDPALVEAQAITPIRPEAWADWAAAQAPSPHRPRPIRSREDQSNVRRWLAIARRIAAKITT